jgi:hypothetical protein
MARKTGVVAVRIRRGDMVFHVYGERAGEEGVYLAEGQVQGIYDAPVTTTWKGGAFQVGGKYKGKKRPWRDMTLGFHVIDTDSSYEFNESAFRQAFQYELDPWDPDRTPTYVEVDTELSGTRRIAVLMYEQPDFAANIDPLLKQHGNVIMKLRAGDPDWSEDDFTSEFKAEAAQASGWITVENPTDQVAYQRLVLTQAVWKIPDGQWVGPPAARVPGGPNAERVIGGIDITKVSGGAIVNWDRSELAFRDANGSNLQGQLGQKFLMYPIPPHTPPTAIPISYHSAPKGGAMARLEVPQKWSRPWGMELQTTIDFQPPLGITRFSRPGEFSYQIPPSATHLDIVMLGGGGGGGAGKALFTGTGGSAGQWKTVTLERGMTLPLSQSTVNGTVGDGGKGGTYKGINPLNGADGYVTAVLTGTSQPGFTAPGGIGSGHTDHVSGDDTVPRSVEYNGVTYTGGGTRSTPGGSGETPGGGGAGGYPLSPGGDGARGQVWIRAYRGEDLPAGPK